MIYIACPASFATGGTELLHQLCFKLNQNNINALMYYYGKNLNNPVAERFKKYRTRYVINIIDHKDNIIFIPEVNTDLVEKFKLSKKFIWWLSVDNYKISYIKYFLFNYKNLNTIIEKIKYLFKYLIKFRKENYIIFNDCKIKHLVQSKYAEEFLKMKKVNQENILYLSDYLNDDFFIEDISIENRENNILYNPKKGIKITKKIIKMFPNYNYIPLQNMTPMELKELYLKSKIYIDFGNHPGKDRIPREAAILGCIVLTNKKGSAKYFEDVSIPEKYKYSDNDIKKLGNDIEYIFNNYGEVFKEYEFYRNKIKNEENIFENEILNLIENLKKE